LGGQIVPDVHEQIEEAGTVLEQIAYGWTDAVHFLTAVAGETKPPT
jgi:hypothetical protein